MRIKLTDNCWANLSIRLRLLHGFTERHLHLISYSPAVSLDHCLPSLHHSFIQILQVSPCPFTRMVRRQRLSELWWYNTRGKTMRPGCGAARHSSRRRHSQDFRAGLVRNRKTKTINREPKTAFPMRFGFAKKTRFWCRFR